MLTRREVALGLLLSTLVACGEGSTEGGPTGGSGGGGTATGGKGGTGGVNATGSGGSASGGAPSSSGGASGQSGGTGGTVASTGGTTTGSTGGASSGGMNAGGGGGTGGGAGTGGRGGMTGGAGSSGSGGTASGGATGTPSVRIVGRIATTSNGNRSGWPGVAYHARFSGTQASIQLNDGSNQNAFVVVVDGGTSRKFTTSSGKTSYELASGLTNGNHDVVVWRATEMLDSGITEFVAINGFSSGGALLAPAAAPERRIEIIGDSISVGAGVEGGASGCAADKKSSNNYLAYGSLAARAVNADVVTIAYSGIGLTRSYSASDPTMPTRYDRTIPSETAAWDFSKYQPHVVVINLGTNDFGNGDPGQTYVDTYVNFVKHVQTKYANAYFILIAMYGNQETAINNVVNNLKSGGVSKVELLKFNSVQNGKGCTGHPDTAGQKAMGDALTARLKAAMGW